jgi:hypothetical protein
MNKKESIQLAVEQLSRPEVHLRVTLASSPEAALVICSRLPGVKELVELGPDAADTVVELLRGDDESLKSESLSTIGLYLLHHINTPETKQALAEAVANDKFRGMNRDLAASAFLRSSGDTELALDDDEGELVPRAKERAYETLGHIKDQM